MATARPKMPAPKQASSRPIAKAPDPWVLRLADAIFRFLSSLKLAVMLISSLAAVLSFATFYESSNGTQAVQVNIYQSKWFALLLAMIGVNVTCAALIRYPWKKRQIGFLITHAGLVTLLIGSFLSIKLVDEGQVAIEEGKSSSTYIRDNYPVILVEQLDPHTSRPTRSFTLPFTPGASAWETQQRHAQAREPSFVWRRNLQRAGVGLMGLALLGCAGLLSARKSGWVSRPFGALMLAGFVASGLVTCAFAWWMPAGPRVDVLSDPSDPFRLAVKDFLPSAKPPQPIHEPSEHGLPMIRLALLAKPPRATEATDALGGRGWIVATPRLKHGSLNAGPAEVTFQYLDGPDVAEALADFLDPPNQPLSEHRARLRYTDNRGRGRVYDWILHDEKLAPGDDGRAHQAGKTITLPDSDLQVTFDDIQPLPVQNAEFGEATGQSRVLVAMFKVKRGDGPGIMHVAWAGLPMAPNVIPPADGGKVPEQLVKIRYDQPPRLGGEGGMMSGRFGLIDVVVTPDGSAHFRAFGRKGLQASGPISLSEPVPIFGGEGMPMQLSLRVDEFLPSGNTRMVCEPRPLAANLLKERARPAALVDLTVGDETRPLWLFNTRDSEPNWEEADFPTGRWRVAFSYDQKNFDFRVHLIDFDPRFDPGSSSRSEYRSDVTVHELVETQLRPTSFSKLKTGQYFQFADRPRETFCKRSERTYVPFEGSEVIQCDNLETEVQPSDKPFNIHMNHTMNHRGWTFFQSSFYPVLDPRTGEQTGNQVTVLTARYDPAYVIVYGGCILVVLGTFVQFYMRAGVFTDGGKRERERAVARKTGEHVKKPGSKRLPPKAASPPADDPEPEL